MGLESATRRRADYLLVLAGGCLALALVLYPALWTPTPQSWPLSLPPTSKPPDPLHRLASPGQLFPEVEKAAWWKTCVWPQPDRSPPPWAARSSYRFSDSLLLPGRLWPSLALSSSAAPGSQPAALSLVLPKGGL